MWHVLYIGAPGKIYTPFLINEALEYFDNYVRHCTVDCLQAAMIEHLLMLSTLFWNSSAVKVGHYTSRHKKEIGHYVFGY